MSVPVTESILTAVSRLIDDAQIEPKREPTHYDLDVQAERCGLRAADPKAQGQNVGKAKRARAMLLWALENDIEAGGRFIAGLVAQVRGYGGFRASSPNYVGEEAIKNAAEAFRSEGYELTTDGQLQPVLLDGLTGPQMTAALMSYVRRAQKGVTDAALVTGTGKDLLEATAKHVLVERKGSCPETTFPALLGLAFVELRMVTSQHPKQPGESAQNALDRALFDVGCAVNRIRNKQGTGHGRPWPPSISEDEARECTELMGIIAGRLLSKL